MYNIVLAVVRILLRQWRPHKSMAVRSVGRQLVILSRHEVNPIKLAYDLRRPAWWIAQLTAGAVNRLCSSPGTARPVTRGSPFLPPNNSYSLHILVYGHFGPRTLWHKCWHDLGPKCPQASPTHGWMALVVWHNGRTSVCDRQTFSVLRSTCSWWVTTYVGKPSSKRLAN